MTRLRGTWLEGTPNADAGLCTVTPPPLPAPPARRPPPTPRVALDAKDPMHYATEYLTPDQHTAVLRAATTLATAAQRMLFPAS